MIADLDRYDRRVRQVMRVSSQVLEHQYKLPAPFKAWRLTQTQGAVILFGVLDDDRLSRISAGSTNVTRLSRYHDRDLLHDLSTLLDGVVVVPCNSVGLGYGFVLDHVRTQRLAREVAFPGYRAEAFRVGVNAQGQAVDAGWDAHLMIAGMTGVGKSTLLRSLADQALHAGHQLAVCDVGKNTFPMLDGYAGLFRPLCTDPTGAADFAQDLLDEIARRETLFRALPAGLFPDDMDEYNRLARQYGLEVLKRIVVIFDEYTDLVLATGGGRSFASQQDTFAKRVTRLVLGARKWGMTLAFAGHTFTRETSGLVREQCRTRICFKVEDHSTASIVVSSGEPTTFTTPGRAYMRGAGRIQAYRVDSARLIERAVGKPEAPRMTVEERQIAHAARENGDCINLPLLKKLGYSESTGEQVLREWDNRGWTAKDRRRGNKRCLTEVARALGSHLEF